MTDKETIRLAAALTDAVAKERPHDQDRLEVTAGAYGWSAWLGCEVEVLSRDWPGGWDTPPESEVLATAVYVDWLELYGPDGECAPDDDVDRLRARVEEMLEDRYNARFRRLEAGMDYDPYDDYEPDRDDYDY